jgi:hypothetical protein
VNKLDVGIFLHPRQESACQPADWIQTVVARQPY